MFSRARSTVLLAAAVVVASTFILGAAAPSEAVGAAQPLEASSTPVIVGEARVGVALTAETEVWRPALVTMKYQWYAGSSAIKGATGTSFTPSSAQIGTTISVKVTGSKSGYITASRTSLPTDAVLRQQAFPAAPLPVISGTAQVGMTLTADAGAWDPTPATITYVWYVGSRVISGATKAALVIPSSAVGQKISVRATASAPGYQTTGMKSTYTATVIKAVPMPVFSTPTLSGTPKVGFPLSAFPGNWGTVPTTFTYQWYSGTTKIAGATGQAFVPTLKYAGKRVSVKVTGSRPGFTSKTLSSPVSGVIGAASSVGPVQVYSAEAIGRGIQVAWEPSSALGQDDSYLVKATPSAGYLTSACPSPSPVTTVESATSTGASVPGLCTGVVYTVTVAATISGITGPPGAPSMPVVPLSAQVPEPPLIVGALPRSGEATISWIAPSYDGGAVVEFYDIVVTSSGSDGPHEYSVVTSPATLGGLTDGVEYSVSLVASNSVGASEPAIAAVTPAPPYEPGAPEAVAGRPDGSGGVVLGWREPVDDGGADITGYVVRYQQVVQATDGSWSVALGASEHTATVDAASLGYTAADFDFQDGFYAFTVSAANSIGEGEPADLGAPIAPQVVVRSNVVVLDAASLATLSAVSDASLTWSLPTEQVRGISAGDVLVLDSTPLLPDGGLRSVVGMSTVGGRLVVATAAASLTDVLDSGSVASDLDALAGAPEGGSALPAGAEFRPSMAGIELVRPALGGEVSLSTSLTFSVAFKGETGSGCKLRAGSCIKYDVKAAINVKPSLSLGLNVSQNMIGIPDGVTVTSSVSVTTKASLTATISGSKKWQVGEITGAPVTIMLGPVPVVAVPRIPVFLTVSGSASLGVTASMTIGASVSWTSKDPGTLTTKNLTTAPELSGGVIPGLSATGKASLSVGFLPTVALYGAGGPSVEASAALEADMNFNPKPGEAFLTISPRIEVKAGLSLIAFGQSTSLQYTVATLTLAKWKLFEVPKPSYIVEATGPASVGVPLQLTAERSDGQSPALTWKIDGGVAGDSISARGVFTAASPPGRAVTITVSDDGGSIGQTTVAIGAVFTAPRAVTVAPAAGPGAVAVSWSAPTSSGGYPVLSYRVTTSSSSAVVSTSALQTVVSNLQSGSTTITVRAVNSKGIASPEASVSVQMSGSGTIAGRAVAAMGSVELPYPNGNYGVTLVDVACGDVGSCAAIANYSILETLADGVWTATPAPAPADQRAGTSPQIYKVACDAPGSCVAVGNYVSSDGDDSIPMIVRLKNGVWTPMPMPSVAGGSRPIGTLWSVDCRDVGDCVAVGGGAGALITRMVGDVWTSVAPALPAMNDTQRDALLTAVVCGQRGTCAAQGLYPVLGTSWFNYYATLDDGTWKTERGPVPSGTWPGTDVSIKSMSCGDGVCIAGGDYIVNGGLRRPMVQAYDNGVWTTIKAPTPSDINPKNILDGTGALILPSVVATACPTSYECVAIGEYGVASGNWKTVSYKYSSGLWSYASAGAPPRYFPVNYLGQGGVADCTDDGDCIAPMLDFSMAYTNGQWGTSASVGARAIDCVGDSTCLVVRGGSVYTFGLQ
ncbi:hypothetical protein BH11ACT5_BH11ACT5_14120 [soil metagenome]